MGRIQDIVDKMGTGIDFANKPTHVIDFDPNAPTKTIRGRNGDFEVIEVKEGGAVKTLSLSNKSLLRQLVAFNAPCRLEITRVGESYATTYNVKKVA